MFITRINQMFHKHGRIVFGVLTIVIIIPFILYFSATPDDILDMVSSGSKKSEITMYGKNIPKEKLDSYVVNTMIAMSLEGYQVDFTGNKNKEEIFQEALNRIRLLKIAEERSIKVSDLQVVAYIKNIRLFKEKGIFNPVMYQRFVQYFLGSYRLGEEDVENVAKENLIIYILRQQTVDGIISTETEARNFYNSSNESYNVKVASFDSKEYKDEVKPTEDELRSYFESNKNKYLLPSRYKADVVRFNFIKYKDEASKSVTATSVDADYAINKSQYKDIDEKTAKMQIRKKLEEQAVKRIVKNKAQKFAVNAYKLIENSTAKSNSVTFGKFAAKSNNKVYHIEDWISADTAVIPRLGKLPQLSQAISQLYMDQSISNAVEGKNAYFVACLTTKEDARPATLAEVEAKVKLDYISSQSLILAREAAQKQVAVFEKDIIDKKDISSDSIFKPFPAFTQSNPMAIYKEKNGFVVYQTALATKEREVSKVADIPNGAIIVYVSTIVLPTVAEYDKNKTENLKKIRATLQQAAWGNYLAMLKTNSDTKIAVTKNSTKS